MNAATRDRPRCTARTTGGAPCRKYPIRGANVCRVHGGAAPQVRAAAKRRLEQAADVLVQRLLGFALDGKVADPVA
ncbi:HGGxSTG domain-containing protein, partial [Mycobacterium sp.]|uniref:HGGxSTG domain-containing protein n=1 Tax=Mycobacterium sp. TaxID=1785 RepID=UPI003C718D0B